MNSGFRISLAYRSVAYATPVEVEALGMESNLIGSAPLEDIVTGDPVKLSLL